MEGGYLTIFRPIESCIITSPSGRAKGYGKESIMGFEIACEWLTQKKPRVSRLSTVRVLRWLISAEVIPKALWSKTAELFFHSGESFTGFVSEDPSPYPISCVLPVVPDQCWLKLDIEGAEYEVLPALLEAGCQPKIISMEIHDFSRRGNKLLNLLKTHGYEWNESFLAIEQCVNIAAFKSS